MTGLITPAGHQAGEHDRYTEAKSIWIDLSDINSREALA